jgi:hypothetical protein
MVGRGQCGLRPCIAVSDRAVAADTWTRLGSGSAGKSFSSEHAASGIANGHHERRTGSILTPQGVAVFV